MCYTILCVLYYVCYTMCTILCALYYVYYTMCVILCVLYYVHYTMRTILCVLYYAYYAVCTILCVLYYVYHYGAYAIKKLYPKLCAPFCVITNYTAMGYIVNSILQMTINKK